MAAFSKSQVTKNNEDEFKRLAKWLNQAPKVVMQAAVSKAHSQVMQSEHLGGKMIHDSSNAAYNWRISVGNMPGVLMQKGKPPVGNSGDMRTYTGKTQEIISVIIDRLAKDANMLDKAIWRAAKIGKVSIVNPIGGIYGYNAKLRDASMASSWEAIAMSSAESAFNSWLSSGPDLDWSRSGRGV